MGKAAPLYHGVDMRKTRSWSLAFIVGILMWLFFIIGIARSSCIVDFSAYVKKDTVKIEGYFGVNMDQLIHDAEKFLLYPREERDIEGHVYYLRVWERINGVIQWYDSEVYECL